MITKGPERTPDDDRTTLAGELALGLKSDRDAALLNDPALAGEVQQWEQEFAQFVNEVHASPPDPRVWSLVEAAIGNEPSPSAAIVGRPEGQTMRDRARHLVASLLLWRSLAGVGFAAATLLGALLIDGGINDLPQEDPKWEAAIVGAVLVSPLLPREGPAAYVATYDVSRRTIFAVPAAIKIRPGQFPKLWLVVSEADDPIALGTLDPERPQAIKLSASNAARVSGTSGLVITLEPTPSDGDGAAGPVIAHGVFTSL